MGTGLPCKTLVLEQVLCWRGVEEVHRDVTHDGTGIPGSARQGGSRRNGARNPSCGKECHHAVPGGFVKAWGALRETRVSTDNTHTGIRCCITYL